MRLLLHTCCAPCAIYPVREARKDNFTVTGFFYNPNIHPYSEYIKRKKDTEVYFDSEGLELVSPGYKAASFFDRVREDTSSPGRCRACWGMRLDEAVSFAKRNRFEAFTTTLLGSPYQDEESLKSICKDLAGENNVSFYYKDFRTGFRDAHRFAKEKGIYCQKYCGCVFSMVEREEKWAKSAKH